MSITKCKMMRSYTWGSWRRWQGCDYRMSWSPGCPGRDCLCLGGNSVPLQERAAVLMQGFSYGQPKRENWTGYPVQFQFQVLHETFLFFKSGLPGPRLTLDSRFSCFSLLCARTTKMYHHTWLSNFFCMSHAGRFRRIKSLRPGLRPAWPIWMI
jgi:hypothetical protein